MHFLFVVYQLAWVLTNSSLYDAQIIRFIRLLFNFLCWNTFAICLSFWFYRIMEHIIQAKTFFICHSLFVTFYVLSCYDVVFQLDEVSNENVMLSDFIFKVCFVCWAFPLSSKNVSAHSNVSFLSLFWVPLIWKLTLRNVERHTAREKMVYIPWT